MKNKLELLIRRAAHGSSCVRVWQVFNAVTDEHVAYFPTYRKARNYIKRETGE